METLIRMAIAWGPLVLIILIWFYFASKMANKNKVRIDDYTELIERQNALLEKAVTALVAIEGNTRKVAAQDSNEN